MTTIANLTKTVAPLSFVAFNDYLRSLGSSLSGVADCGGEYKIVRKRDGVTVFGPKQTRNFEDRWACFLSNATNPKIPFDKRGSTENIINEKETLKTQEEVKAHYEMVIVSWAPSSEFPERAKNGTKGEKNVVKPLTMLETLNLAQAKLNTELETLRDQQRQLSEMVAAKEMEIRKGAKLLAAFESDDEDEEEAQDSELGEWGSSKELPRFLLCV